MFNWIIEECIFDNKERFEEAKQIIESFGDKWFSYKNLYDWDFTQLGTCEQRIPLCSLKSYKNAIPGVDLNPYKVTYWTQFIEDNYINSGYHVIPFWRWCDDEYREKYFSWFGDEIFIKPDKGTKSFTGYCPDMFEFEMDMKSIFKGMKSDDLIILSEKKQLPEYEYRFYIINNEICTYSSYSWVRNDHREVPKGAIEYVKQIIPRIKLADEFENPITSYTLDIVYSDDIMDWCIVDLNCINTSGTYNCDLKSLLEGMRKQKINDLRIGVCLHWEQCCTYIDNDPEQEEWYDYCNKKHCQIYDGDCTDCLNYEEGFMDLVKKELEGE